MKEILKELDLLAKARITELHQAKKDGVPVVEYTGTLIPEEMVRAAGAETYLLLRGGQPEPAEAVLDYMLRYMHPLARCMLGFHELNMDPVTPIADLIVGQITDSHIARIIDLMEYKGLPVGKVGIPGDWKKEIAFGYYENSLKKLLKKVEGITGKPVDMEKAKENFAKSNQINELLRKIGELRKKDNPPIGFQEFLRLHHLSFIIDPDVMIKKLTEIYAKLENAPGKFEDGVRRIMVAGRAFAIEDYVMPKVLEASGGVIVTEFMDEGMRVTELDVNLEGDLLQNFVQNRYRDMTPNNAWQPAWRQRFEHMLALYKEYNCDGFIWYQLSFDEIYDMECTCLAKWFEEENVPFLKLESSYEYSRENMGHLTTRLESFVESLKEV